MKSVKKHKMQGLKRNQRPLNSVTSSYRQKLKLGDKGLFKVEQLGPHRRSGA